MITEAYRDWQAARAAIARTDVFDPAMLDHQRAARLAVARLAACPVRSRREAGMLLEAACSAIDELPEPWLDALRAVRRFLDSPLA